MDQEKKLEELEVVGKEQDEIETEEEDEVLPDWFDGKHFFDVLFCQEYLAEHPMVCVGGEFFTKEGKVTDETAVVKEMYQEPSGTSQAEKGSRRASGHGSQNPRGDHAGICRP